MDPAATIVPKACAYITRDAEELLVFEGPDHDGLQIPKGTVEPDEPPREAVHREIVQESGIRASESPRRLTIDLWQRRASPPRYYVRHFFHVSVTESRDRWNHTVTGEGSERGLEYEFSWVELPPSEEFALSLDDYVHHLDVESVRA
jgi:ADP-ribose pyrophosphatase YjhB (NUDIX family)